MHNPDIPTRSQPMYKNATTPVTESLFIQSHTNHGMATDSHIIAPNRITTNGMQNKAIDIPVMKAVAMVGTSLENMEFTD
ncbi:hypothetical protein Q8A64_17215 [Oxalobacteraceae bacterium R-40]|uniref:Uncharacterized protein n=1 Tax=Keguizhuia sedimenti TaxID=3064264 RepID=A0ABU1BT12_9BURK|nr:hypothetical protein [Oxalobacteraceae bacterium R-40]